MTLSEVTSKPRQLTEVDHAAPDHAGPNAFQCTGFTGLGPNRCSRCGAGDRPEDPLLPFGVEPDHSWQHMACWNEARGPGEQ